MKMPGQPGFQPPGVVTQYPSATQPIGTDAADLNNSFRKLCFKFLAVLVFIRFSMLHQLLTYKLGGNLFLLYVFGLPPVLGFLFTGGFRRAFRFRVTTYWVLFAACLLCSCVFSTWRGGSAGLVVTYLRTDFLMLFLIAGLAVGWKECRTLLFSIALGCLATEVWVRLFRTIDSQGRTSLTFGTVANSNDYAAHLILIIPLLLWAAMSSKNFVFRVVAFMGVAYGYYLIVASASRGAFIALIVMMICILFMATSRQRIIGLFVTAAMLVSAIALAPSLAVQRILSYSAASTDSTLEALESSQIRMQLLKDSVWLAITHPVLGVGPGQFSVVEGRSANFAGRFGLYYEAHNSFMTVASECGTPALILYLSGIVSSFLLLNKIFRKVASDPSSTDVRDAVVCLKAALLAYCTAITFVNFAYFFYLPAFAGLIAAMAASFPEAVPNFQGGQISHVNERTPVHAGPVRRPLPKPQASGRSGWPKVKS
jgi:O-antigen ligase